MKIVSWNVHGLGCQVKRAAVKVLLRSWRANIRLIQETKLSVASQNIINWVYCEANGASGGHV